MPRRAGFVAVGACIFALLNGCGGVDDGDTPASGGSAGQAGQAGGGSAGQGAATWATGGSAGEATDDAGADGAGDDAMDAGQDAAEDAAADAAPDAADAEVDAGPDACAAKADGAYCGAALGLASSLLVTCAAGETSTTKTCSSGCLQTSIGSDACKSSCCLAKPPGAFVRGYNACSSYSGGSSHYAIDYSSPVGTKIPAGMDGTVAKVVTGYGNCWGSGSGSIACSNTCMAHYNLIRIKSACGDPDHPSKDFFIEYAHVSKLATGIKVGSVVKKGQIIAYVGESGCASGPHIHFETMSVAKGATPTVHTCTSVNPSTRYCP